MRAVGNKLLMFIYYFLSAFILEAITFHILGFGGMPEYFLYDFAIIIFFSLVVYIIPNFTAQYVLYTILLLIQAILSYVNYTLYTIYGDLFSWEMISLIGEATNAVTSNFIYFSVILELVAVYLAIFIVGLMLLRYCKKFKVKFKQHFSVLNVMLLVSLQCLTCAYYIDKRNEINNSEYFMNSEVLKSANFKKYGTFGYLANMTIKKQDNVDLAKEYFESGEIFNQSAHPENEQDIFGVDKDNNVIVIMMESLEWICFGDGTYDEQVTNLSYELTPHIYELIYGQGSIETDPTNVNKADDALISTNFYAKSKTNFSEAYSILGFYPNNENLNERTGKSYNKALNAYGYTLPNMLKNSSENGYTTSYIHSNVASFYDRSETHGNLGFDNVIGKENVEDEEGNKIYTDSDLYWEHWEAEGDFARNTLNYIVPDTYNEKPFYSFYLNVSSHGSYSYNENEVDCLRYMNYVKYGKENCVQNPETKIWELINPKPTDPELIKDWVEPEFSAWYQNVYDAYYDTDPALCDELMYYECGVMGLDEAIGVIVDELIKKDIYDKTTMLLYSDHYSYYSNLSNRFKGLPVSDSTSMEVNRIPMILRSPGIIKLQENSARDYTINTRFCSAYDIIPTILDLKGISFNENMYLGNSIFAPARLDQLYYVDGETNPREMFVYFSNTGGWLCSRDIYSADLSELVVQTTGIDDKAREIFKTQAQKLVVKVYYLNTIYRRQCYNDLIKP